MIIRENITIDGRPCVRIYSDAGRYVVGGEPYGEYEESIDPAGFDRAYVEGGIISTEGYIGAKAEAYDILMGVD